VEIQKQIGNIALINSVHNLNLWSLDGEHTVLTAHMVAEKNLTPEEYALVKKRFKQIVDDFGIFHSTLEIELPDESCRIEESPSNGT
jgi:cobalt-zinc-cadmium efflux system protein